VSTRTHIDTSPHNLFKKLNINDGKLNSTSFELACPVILEQLESQAYNRYQLVPDNADLKTKPSETEGIIYHVRLCSTRNWLIFTRVIFEVRTDRSGRNRHTLFCYKQKKTLSSK
jgi:hypothetical protein